MIIIIHVYVLPLPTYIPITTTRTIIYTQAAMKDITYTIKHKEPIATEHKQP